MNLSGISVVNFRAYRTILECKDLLKEFEASLANANIVELTPYLFKWVEESRRFPDHILTITKGLILINAVKRTKCSNKMRDKALRLEERLETKIRQRLEVLN